MVVKIDASGLAVAPLEDEPPLQVDAEGVPPCQISAQPFKVVAWRRSKVGICCRVIQQLQFVEEAIAQV